MGEEFKNDYLNMMPENELLAKYDISHTTYYRLLKRLNIKRERATKINRLLGRNENNSILPPIKEPIPKKIIDKTNNIPEKDLLDENLVYGKQYVPRNTEIEVNKTKPKPVVKKEKLLKDVDNNELDEILNRADKTFSRIQNKKLLKTINQCESKLVKTEENNDKSELLNAINRSTQIRQKILNKKNNN